ncbi:MAG: zinc-dependent metalloprotease [Candidatus Eremiobacteraeota bacterium]|nr:zinc-dependent metalloprotease [Candidatus Eremiobacteraeota bacterium]
MQAVGFSSESPLLKTRVTAPAPKGEAAPAGAQDTLTLSAPSSAPAKTAAPAASTAPANPTQGAEEIPGFLKVLKKGDKTYLSLAPEQFNKPFFFSVNTVKSLGEGDLVGSEMGRSQLAEFRRLGNQIQLVALNTQNFAEEGTPQAQFVSEDFAESLIASTPLVTGDPSKKEVLLEANALLLNDIPGYVARLASNYKTPFTFDAKNAGFTSIDNGAEQTSFGVQAHYQAPGITPTGGSLPGNTPEARSLLTEFRYNFLALPETPMQPRLADERIGHFVANRQDYTSDETDGKVRMVKRWRLEKKDPNAALSEPVQPIVYWLDKNIPENYRESVKAGVLEWNKAFETAGFKNAVEVRQQTDKDDFNTLDARHASIRWYTASGGGASVGPSHMDPRTGEILDADIRISAAFGRGARKAYNEEVLGIREPQHNHAHGEECCEVEAHSAEEMAFMQDYMVAQGDTSGAEAMAQANIKRNVMHEVGHTLGLRHNFKGSTAFTSEQLQDAEFTKVNGMGTSIMDYYPFNIAAPGEKQGEFIMSTLGAYDYLAIQYAYAQVEPGREKDTLEGIASKVTRDALIDFETDEAADAMDPNVVRHDLGKDTLGFAQKTVTIGQDLLNRIQNQELPEGAEFKKLTQAFNSGLSKVARGVSLATRHLGGVHLYRDRQGDGHAPFEPVPAETQRKSLNLILDTMFAEDSLKVKPELAARLARDRFEARGDQNQHTGSVIVAQQGVALAALYDSGLAQRLIDSPEKVGADVSLPSLPEVYDAIQTKVWSELGAGKEISQGRRDLQREQLRQVLEMIKPDSKAPGEAISVMRYVAGELGKQIDKAMEGQLSIQTRAHLDQCRQKLTKALA